MTREEFKELEELTCCHEDKETALCAATYFCFQFVMIGRLDDTTKFRQPDLQPCPIKIMQSWAICLGPRK